MVDVNVRRGRTSKCDRRLDQMKVSVYSDAPKSCVPVRVGSREAVKQLVYVNNAQEAMEMSWSWERSLMQEWNREARAKVKAAANLKPRRYATRNWRDPAGFFLETSITAASMMESFPASRLSSL